MDTDTEEMYKCTKCENGKYTWKPFAAGSSPGEDGFSPSAVVQQTESGAVITIKDKDGTTTATIANGKDGYTPVKGVDYFDGVDGKDGEKGDPGEKGDQWVLSGRITTPVNGTVSLSLYKNGVLYEDAVYLYSQVSSDGANWRQHGSSTGTMNGTKTWSYGGTADGIAWQCDAYTDSSKSELLASISLVASPQGPQGDPGSDAEVTKENIEAALGYTPADNADLGKKLDAYIFTGTVDNSADGEDYMVELDDNYKWDDMVAAINAGKYVLCVLWSEVNLSPLYLIPGETWFSDGYAVFTALGEYGNFHEMTLFEDNTAIIEVKRIPFGSSGSAGAAFYTELARTHGSVCVIAHGLTVGETYAVHLYTSARRRGSSQDPWRHPSNENTGEGYTGKGYANLVGTQYKNSSSGVYYPDVPDWMPNNGILQTEWEFTATAETERLDIALGAWLLPLLKPVKADFSLDTYGLIGVANTCYAPLMFRFCVVKDGIVGECRDTLRVGLRTKNENGTRKLVMITGVADEVAPWIGTGYLYTSIK